MCLDRHVDLPCMSPSPPDRKTDSQLGSYTSPDISRAPITVCEPRSWVGGLFRYFASCWYGLTDIILYMVFNFRTSLVLLYNFRDTGLYE